MTAIWNNVRYAFRQLRRSPGFAFTVVLTLALGVAANTVAFSLLNSLVLRPLHLPGSERLVFFNTFANGHAWPSLSYPDYRDLRDRMQTLDGLAAYRVEPIGIGYRGDVNKGWAMEASGNYFDLLGVRPALGRFFHPGDERGANNSPYVVLDSRYWREHFAGDPAIVGRVVELDKHPYTVLGVAPASFSGTELFVHPDVWVPTMQQPQLEGFNGLENRSSGLFWLIGRLRPGATRAEANSDANRVAAALARQNKEDEGLHVVLGAPGLVGEMLGSPVRAFVWSLLALSAILLLAACANLGSLFTARASDRARELAVRLALGARHSTVAAQLVFESLLLSLIGGALGVVLAVGLVHLIDIWRPSMEFPAQLSVSVDGLSMGAAALLSSACGIFFGLLPLRQIARADTYAVIKYGPSLSSGKPRWSGRDVLLLLQIVACSLLVTGSLVALRGLERTLHASFGFDAHGVTLAGLDFKMAGYTDTSALAAERRTIDRLRNLPGVSAASFSGSIPLSLNINTTAIYRDGVTDTRPSNIVASANFFVVAPDFLRATGIPLLAGRDLRWEDTSDSQPVLVVNRELIRRVWGPLVSPGQAIGRFVSWNGKRTEVVGVVADGKYESITEDQLPAVFMSIAQSPEAFGVFVTRGGTTEAVRRVVREVEPNAPATVGRWTDELGLALFPAEAASLALGVLGGLAALLAVTGIFGMASYTVTRRLREFGIRMALGAGRMAVLRAALARPAVLLGAGSLLGLGLGVAASRLLGQIVYGASASDPLVLLGAVLMMGAVAFVATWLPAQRAVRVNPARLLREE